MEPIVLRDEDPPDDIVVVVRGGEMKSEFVKRTATRAHQEFGIYALSVYAALDADVETLCRSIPDLNRYGRVRTSTFGTLRSAGFALIPTLPRPHFDIVLPDLSDSILEQLESCFGRPFSNPGRQPPAV